jgi:molybdopterin-guanine dinucleotide biosynthesis protein A
MGTDKALLCYHGMPQIRYLAPMLEAAAPPTSVSVRQSQASDPAFEGLHLLPDPVEGIGPLAGLLAAFAFDPHSAWLVVAVDMPWIVRATLDRLLAAREPKLFATCYRIPGEDLPDPVCAIYEPKIVPVLERARERRRYSLMLLRDLPIRIIDSSDERELRGVNDLEEYRAARKGSPRA